MRAVVQRVRCASVSVAGERVGSIERGLVVFLGIGQEDDESDIEQLTRKLAHLRVFEDDQGRLNQSALQQGRAMLVVPNFTLYGDARKGRRPSFTRAAPPDRAQALYQTFLRRLAEAGVAVSAGRFGARMIVQVENEGPVTLLLSSGEEF